MPIRISTAAKQLGIHPNTLRALEKRGKISVRRDWAGYRIFTQDELIQIEQKLFHREAQTQGQR